MMRRRTAAPDGRQQAAPTHWKEPSLHDRAVETSRSDADVLSWKMVEVMIVL